MTFDRRVSESAFALHGKYPWLDRVAIFCARELIVLEGLALLFVLGHLLASLRGQSVSIADLLHFVPTVLVAALTAWGLAILIEVLVKRPRPYVALSKKPLDRFWTPTPSFPSSHAAMASALAVFTVTIGPWTVPAAFFVIVLLIAAARVYVGVHYVSDVVAGIVFGPAAWFIVAGIFVLFPILAP